MLSRGMAIGLALTIAGCSFDATGSLFSGTADGGLAADARPGAPDSRPGAADARPGRPDADTGDPAGTVRSRSGSVDMYDGNFDDWEDAPAYSFEIDGGMDFHPIQGYTPSAKLTFASKHDSEFIYLALIIEDPDVLPAEHPLWRDDSIAVYLDAAGDRDGAFGNDDHEIIIGSGGTYLDYAPGSVNAELSGNAFSTANGYALEIGISKSTLGVGTLPDVIGFDIAINDDDTYGDAAFGLWFKSSRPRCASCCTGFDHAEPWCDTTVFGSLILE